MGRMKMHLTAWIIPAYVAVIGTAVPAGVASNSQFIDFLVLPSV